MFADGADMLCQDDLAKLLELKDPFKAVQVVKHDYVSRHVTKYVGTTMEARNEHYERKNWASLMLINCSHFAWRKIDPEYIRKASKLEMLQLRFIPDEHIGDLPKEWNWLADEYGINESAKILHATAGIPLFPRYAFEDYAPPWERQYLRVTHACT